MADNYLYDNEDSEDEREDEEEGESTLVAFLDWHKTFMVFHLYFQQNRHEKLQGNLLGDRMLGARDSWFGVANSTRDQFKVKTYEDKLVEEEEDVEGKCWRWSKEGKVVCYLCHSDLKMFS